jgi:hypothetical protein
MGYRIELLDQLKTQLAPRRFHHLPQLSQYRKVTESGFYCVVLSAGGAAPPVIAEVQLGIRLNIVEQLAYQFTTGSDAYGPHSTTLLVSMGQLQSQPYQRYVLEKPTDVPRVASVMNNFIASEGLDFFHCYDSIAALDELYNGTDTRWLPHLGHRSLRGIILAKLAHRPNWSALVAHYREQLQRRGTPEAIIKRYEQLAAYLHHFSVN